MTRDEFMAVLSPSLFWEYDFKKLDPEKNRRLFMERILIRGNWEQFLALVNYYSPEVVKKCSPEVKTLDKKTANFLHLVLHIPKKNFRCFSDKQFRDPFGF
jgi:hypothetical protein